MTATRHAVSITLAFPSLRLCLIRSPHHTPCPSVPTVEDWGQLGVYRVFFAVAVFHALLGLIMIGVKNSRDVRAGLQNGMWAIKLMALIGMMVGAFFIHNSFYVGTLCDAHEESVMGNRGAPAYVNLSFFSTQKLRQPGAGLASSARSSS